MLDTNICIYLIKQMPPEIIEHFRRHEVGEIGISSITLAELRYGVAKSLHVKQNQDALNEFILPLEIVHFDERAAQIYGAVRASLEKIGKPVGSLDTLIGAHALSIGAVLVTKNVREFKRIKDLKVVDWSV